MGAGLQDGLDKLKIGNGELRRATCWGRRVEVTETVTVTERKKLIGVTETCTSETGRQVTELTETREVVERLHGVEVTDAHTHTHIQVVSTHPPKQRDGITKQAEDVKRGKKENGE